MCWFNLIETETETLYKSYYAGYYQECSLVAIVTEVDSKETCTYTCEVTEAVAMEIKLWTQDQIALCEILVTQ